MAVNGHGFAGAVSTSEPDQAIKRTVIHSEAYKKREGLGPHIEIKVTPPEGRGRKGMVLVEVYNYSRNYLASADFWLNLTNSWGDSIDTHITCEDIKGGWSALKWIHIPGNRQIPEITKINVMNMKMFSEQAKELKMKYTIDLIKK